MALLTLLASFAAVANAAPVSSEAKGASSLPIAVFDGSSPITWRTENDPVMGGQSVSTFTIDKADKVGKWVGQVRIVPFLRAPGFCTLRGDGDIPSLAQYKGLQFTLQKGAATNISKYQMMIISSNTGGNPRGGEFQANFELGSSATSQEVFVPFSSFVESWRGEKVGGAPNAAQLASIKTVGLGSAGIAGNFAINIVSIVATNDNSPSPNPGPAPAVGKTMVSFGANEPSNYKWFVVNDPVMGGRSSSTITESGGLGIFNGTVAIVPQLKAPGFCNAEARPTLLQPRIDVSSYLSGGIVYKLKSTGPMNTFKAAFGTSTQYDFNSYKADFTVPNTGNFETVYIPFNSFSNKWSAATGEPTETCAKNPSVCPTSHALADIGSIGIWAEGTAGDFHVEMQSIYASMGPN